jgi:hypothetical protein
MTDVVLRRDQDTDVYRGKMVWRHREKNEAIYRPRREASEKPTL